MKKFAVIILLSCFSMAEQSYADNLIRGQTDQGGSVRTQLTDSSAETSGLIGSSLSMIAFKVQFDMELNRVREEYWRLFAQGADVSAIR